MSCLQTQDGTGANLSRRAGFRGADLRVFDLPSYRESFFSRRSDEDRRRGLVGQRAKAAASLLISRCFAAGPKSIRGCRFQVRRSRQSRSELLAPSPSSHRFVCRLAADTGAGV